MADHLTQFEPIGQAFVKHYYTLFDNPQTRASDQLSSLYLQPQCFQTFEGNQAAGTEAIKAKLSFFVSDADSFRQVQEPEGCRSQPRSDELMRSFRGSSTAKYAPTEIFYLLVAPKALTFQRIARQITSVDCQPLPDGILVVVLGQLKTDEDQPQSYVETFILKAAQGTFFISNNVFRLALHHA